MLCFVERSVRYALHFVEFTVTHFCSHYRHRPLIASGYELNIYNAAANCICFFFGLGTFYALEDLKHSRTLVTKHPTGLSRRPAVHCKLRKQEANAQYSNEGNNRRCDSSVCES